MLNIIGNSCISAYIQKFHLKQEFQNPFCWCTVSAKDMQKLIKNYEKINWLDSRLIKKGNYYFISVSHTFCIKFVHYHYNRNEDVPKVVTTNNSEDVYYKKIDEYILEKYKDRTSRLLRNKLEPIFIIGNIFSDQKITFEIAKSITEDLKYKVIFVTDDVSFLQLVSDIVDVIIYDLNTLGDGNKTEQLAKQVYDRSKFFKS